MILKRVIFILVLLAAVGGAVAYHFAASRAGGNGDLLHVSGNIEVIAVDMGFKIPGRVVERPVDEGQQVHKGQLIARLETKDLEADVAARSAEFAAAQAVLDQLLAGSRKEEKESAQATMEKARAALAELQAGSRPQEIEAASALVNSATVEEARLKDEAARAERLYNSHTISVEDRDRGRAAYKVAKAKREEAEERFKLVKIGPRQEDIDQAKAALDQATAQHKMVMIGPRVEEIAQGRAKAAQAAAALELAKTRLGYATITSPIDGVVLSKNVEPGEYVSPGTPVVTIGDLAHPWLRAYVEETNQGRVKYGQEANVTTDSRPGQIYQGRISFIANEAEFTPRSVQTEKERVKLVYRIKIEVENPRFELKRGMPADADIALGTAAEKAK
jgi:HlyD family secretion protein